MNYNNYLSLFRILQRIASTGPMLIFISSAHGQTHLSVESGLFWQTSNDIQIPRNEGAAFDLNEIADGDSSTFVRFTLDRVLYKRHELRLIYAPLRLQLLGDIDRPLQVAGESIEPAAVLGSWRLRSNRITWRYRGFNKSRWSLKTGMTLLVLDRKIRLDQGDEQISHADTRRLPLIHISGQYLIYKRWQLGFDMDGNSRSQNGFYDLGLRLEYDTTRRKVYSLGYRSMVMSIDDTGETASAKMHLFTAGIKYRF